MFGTGYSILITALLLSRSSHGDIGCHCDAQSCKLSRTVECRADYYCYISFQAMPQNNSFSWPAGRRKPKHQYKATHRGCVAKAQITICTAGGLYPGSLLETGDQGLQTLVRCCKDSWCNGAQTLDEWRAAAVKDFGPSAIDDAIEHDTAYPAYSHAPQPIYAGYESENSDLPRSIGLFRKRENSRSSSLTRGTLVSPIRANENRGQSGDSAVDDGLSVAAGSTHSNRDDNPEVVRSTNMLQPLHIAIGVCFVILILVAVLLHVVIVLHRRHRCLKRELQQTQQKPRESLSGHSHSPLLLHRHQEEGKSQTGKQSRSSVNGSHAMISFDVQSSNQQTNRLGPQQRPYRTGNSAFHYQVAHKTKERYGRCPLFCFVYNRRSMGEHKSSFDVYEEPNQSTRIATSAAYMPPHSLEAANTQQFKETPTLNSVSVPHTAVSGNIYSQIGENATNLETSVLPGTGNDNHLRYQSADLGHSLMYTGVDNLVIEGCGKLASTYAPGSSMSGGSGNNPSTAESSLPTNSLTGTWTDPRCCAFRQISTAVQQQQQQTMSIERPSLSGSSEVGTCAILGSSEFDMRRANVALPIVMTQQAAPNTAIAGSPGSCLSFPFAPVPPPPQQLPPDTPSSPGLLGLASFRSADGEDPCALVTPYAQLQLSLTLDQYDTPEEIFRAGGSESSDSYAQHASSNPTTNSSLLHSYCEHICGDYRS